MRFLPPKCESWAKTILGFGAPWKRHGSSCPSYLPTTAFVTPQQRNRYQGSGFCGWALFRVACCYHGTGRGKAPEGLQAYATFGRRGLPNPFLHSLYENGISRRRKLAALLFAAIIDGLRLFSGGVIGGIDPLDDLADIIAVVALLMIVGFRWQIALAFVAELIPGVAIFPTWTALVLTLPVKNPPALPGSGDDDDSMHDHGQLDGQKPTPRIKDSNAGAA